MTVWSAMGMPIAVSFVPFCASKLVADAIPGHILQPTEMIDEELIATSDGKSIYGKMSARWANDLAAHFGNHCLK
jgi:hypothetical protein